MQHERAVPVAILPDIACPQPFRQVRVDLERAALPDPADRVGQIEIELRPVECAIAGFERVVPTHCLDRVLKCAFDVVPAFVASDPLFGAGGEANLEFGKTQFAIYIREEVDEPGAFILDLVFGAEDMRVVLREAAHPHDAVQRAGRLEPGA